MPTDNSVQTPVTPVATTVTAPPASSTQAIADDAIKAHPLYKDLETRYAAAHKEIDGKKTKKELEAEVARLKVLAGEDAPVVPPVQQTAGSIDATKLQADIEWNIANKDLIKLGGQQYVDLLNKGYDKQDALDLATSRLPTPERSAAENLRAQVSASAGASTDRTPNQAPIVGGVSKDYIESMRKQFPNLPEEKLVEIVQRSVTRNAERGA